MGNGGYCFWSPLVRSVLSPGNPRARAVSCAALFCLLAVGCGDKRSQADLERGMESLRRGDAERAERYLAKATRRQPDSATAFGNLGAAYWQLGQRKEAALAFRRAADLDNTNAPAFEWLGRALTDLNRWDDARAALKRADELNPDNPRILTALSVVEYRGGDKHNAHLLLSKALNHAPDYPPALYNLAVLHRDHYTNRTDALLYFRRYLTVAGTNSHVAAARAEIERKQPVTSNAVAVRPPVTPAVAAPAPKPAVTSAPPARALPPRTASEAAPLVKRARAAIQTEEYDEALTLLNDATTRDPRNADALWELALLYDKYLQSQDKAALTYDRFRKLFPNDPRNKIASPAQSRREAPPAETTGPSSRHFPPPGSSSDPRAQARDLWRRALAQYQAGRWDASIADYQQALTLDPKFADAAYNLGFAFKAKGEERQAQKAFAQALAIKPDLAPAEYMLAVLCRDMNEPDAAIEHAKRALQIRPAYAEAHLLIGILYRDAMRYDAARLHFKKAAELAPDEVLAGKARAGLRSVGSR